jgi:hypothetical protein
LDLFDSVLQRATVRTGSSWKMACDLNDAYGQVVSKDRLKLRKDLCIYLFTILATTMHQKDMYLHLSSDRAFVFKNFVQLNGTYYGSAELYQFIVSTRSSTSSVHV